MSESKSPARKAKKRWKREVRTCEGKDAYDSELAMHGAKLRAWENNRLRLGHYICLVCAKYHLTKGDGFVG